MQDNMQAPMFLAKVAAVKHTNVKYMRPEDLPIKTKLFEPDENGDTVELDEDLEVEDEYGKLKVPRGFRSDGASVPRALWGVVTPPIDPRSIRAAVIHDYLYRQQPEGWDKKRADRLFRRLLIEDGLSKVRANAAYIGLGGFGDRAWYRNGDMLEAARQAARNHILQKRQQTA